jgi:poly(3-hydroxybutyrate) depolymerase
MRSVRGVAAAAVLVVFVAGCDSTKPAPAPAAPIEAASADVSFVVDGTTTYGTLQVPAHRAGQRLAAALLLAGSGPSDRDGNQPPGVTPGTLRQFADTLGGLGIASLRFDKYFTGRTGFGQYASDPGSIDLNAFLRQAAGGYQYLAKQPDVDPKKLLIVGHSEGGMYAILLAPKVSPAPAGLGLIEPQDERLLDLVALQLGEQLDDQVTQGSITVGVAQANKARIAEAISRFRAGETVDTSGLLPAVVSGLAPLVLTPANAKSARTDDAIDPPAFAARVPGGTRVLVTDGTSDTHVPPTTIRPLIDGLTSAGTTGPGLVTLPGLGHFLVPAGTPINGAPLDPSFLTALKDWAKPYTATP